MLELFTEITGVAKGLQYSVSDESLAKMTKFSQSVWKMKISSDIIYPNSNSTFFAKNQTALTVDEWVSTVGGAYETIYTHLKNKKDADSVFLGNFIEQKTWVDTYLR